MNLKQRTFPDVLESRAPFRTTLRGDWADSPLPGFGGFVQKMGGEARAGGG
jgi:hypothetical protein